MHASIQLTHKRSQFRQHARKKRIGYRNRTDIPEPKSWDSSCKVRQHPCDHANNDNGETKDEAPRPRCQGNRQKIKQSQRALVSGQIIYVSYSPYEQNADNHQPLAGKCEAGKTAPVGYDAIKPNPAWSRSHFSYLFQNPHSPDLLKLAILRVTY